MTFLATTKGSDDVKIVLSAISTLVEEATFVVNSECIKFKAMDPSHVALIDIEWPSSSFMKYECDTEIRFGVRVSELSKLIKRAEKTDEVTISVDAGNLLIGMGKNKQYKMRLIESDLTQTPDPKLVVESKLELSSEMFNKILGDVAVVSDYINLKCSNNNIDFSGKGDTGEVVVTVEKGMPDLIDLSTTNECNGTYSLEFLIPIVSAIGYGVKSVTCHVANGRPLLVEWKVFDNGKIKFYLAPRISN
jgi:proliferating cell nuclear antigen